MNVLAPPIDAASAVAVPPPGEGGAPDAATQPAGWLRILPHQREGGLDGFFVAGLVRRSDRVGDGA